MLGAPYCNDCIPQHCNDSIPQHITTIYSIFLCNPGTGKGCTSDYGMRNTLPSPSVLDTDSTQSSKAVREYHNCDVIPFRRASYSGCTVCLRFIRKSFSASNQRNPANSSILFRVCWGVPLLRAKAQIRPTPRSTSRPTLPLMPLPN